MPNKLRLLFVLLMLLVVIYFTGPHPATPKYTTDLPEMPSSFSGLEAAVTFGEFQHAVKPNNEARIVWANDSAHKKTPYAIVYLHGFSASQEEGNPIHRNIAKAFGCNLYLARLPEHGIDTADAMINFTADEMWEGAKRAYAIAKCLGKKVIIMGTSTGGSLALQLAATYPEIAGVVLLSPNIEINNPKAWLLNNHWGLQIARQVQKSDFFTVNNPNPEYQKYWTSQYRLEAAAALEEYLETAMTKHTFEKVTQPVLCLYYYKDEEHQDLVVKVSAMKTMFEALGTASAQKRMIPIPNAESHVLGCPIQSKDIITPQLEIAKFLKGVVIR